MPVTVPLPQDRYQQMRQDYLAWHRDVHAVDTHYVTDASGVGFLTGSDYLRILGNGSFTFSAGVADGVREPLARQDDRWTLEREGYQITARFGELITSQGASPASRACHPLVLIRDFSRRRSAFAEPGHILLGLYIGGNEFAAARAQGMLKVPDPAIPTLISIHGDASTS